MKIVEAMIAKQCIADLLAAGFYVTMHDGEEDMVIRSRDADAIFAAMATTDEDYLFVSDKATGAANKRADCGWVRFIYGNSGPEVINDYTTRLEKTIAPTNKLAETLDDGNADTAIKLFMERETAGLRLALQVAITELEYAQEKLGSDRAVPRTHAIEGARLALRAVQPAGGDSN